MLKRPSLLKNKRGNAIVEIVPILAVFVLLLNFSLGFFGLIHSGILNSIAARNYAFETFRNRSNLNYLRDTVNTNKDVKYAKVGMRYHGAINENARSEAWIVTQRPIKFTELSGDFDIKGTSEHDGTVKAIEEGVKASDKGIDEGVNPAWVRTIYGICLNAACGS